jgi:hypothetical protein
MSHLKTIGCDTYVHIPKKNRSKLDVKNKKCTQWDIMIMLRLIDSITFLQKL